MQILCINEINKVISVDIPFYFHNTFHKLYFNFRDLTFKRSSINDTTYRFYFFPINQPKQTYIYTSRSTKKDLQNDSVKYNYITIESEDKRGFTMSFSYYLNLEYIISNASYLIALGNDYYGWSHQTSIYFLTDIYLAPGHIQKIVLFSYIIQPENANAISSTYFLTFTHSLKCSKLFNFLFLVVIKKDPSYKKETRGSLQMYIYIRFNESYACFKTTYDNLQIATYNTPNCNLILTYQRMRTLMGERLQETCAEGYRKVRVHSL